MSNPTQIPANTAVPSASGQYFKIYTVDPAVTSYTVTDLATGRVLDVTGGTFMTISDAGFSVSVACYAVPFDGAPMLGGGDGGSGGDCNVTITDNGSIVCGEGATANGAGGSVAIGYNAKVKETANNNYTSTNADTASTSVAYGANAAASVRSVAVGGLAKAGSVSSTSYTRNTAIGFGAQAGTNNYATTAIGSNATAIGDYATAIGEAATASGFAAFAIGSNATASSFAATAIGYASTASDSSAFAIGESATASGIAATAIGDSATAIGEAATAIGSYAVASGYCSTAIGAYCKNVAPGTTAVLAGYEAPSDENDYVATAFQMHFFVKGGAPHVGFAKIDSDDNIIESYAVDLSRLSHVSWSPGGSGDGCGCGC